MTRRSVLVIILLSALVLAAAALRLLASPSSHGMATLAMPEDALTWALRGRRVVAGIIVGGALGASGVLLQALLRNPLAAPGVLGLTSGAGLGVVIWIYIGYRSTGTILQGAPPIAPPLLGALATLAIVTALGRRRGVIDPISLVLIGVVMSVICSAGMMFFQHLLPAQGWGVATRWTLGSISDELTWTRIGVVGAVTLAGVTLGVTLSRAMDASSLTDDEAHSVGVRLVALRRVLFLTAGAMTAGAVVLAGPIGFVGLVCPHAVRLMAGPSHRSLVIGSALAGGALIVLADAAVRLIDLGAGRMPIGVLTAMLGGPALIWLLRHREAAP